MNPKTLHKDNRHNKLVLRGREGIFMGYSDSTEKHLKMYVLDLRRTILISRLSVDELVSGGTVDLRLRCLTGPNRTPINSPNR